MIEIKPSRSMHSTESIVLKPTSFLVNRPFRAVLPLFEIVKCSEYVYLTQEMAGLWLALQLVWAGVASPQGEEQWECLRTDRRTDVGM